MSARQRSRMHPRLRDRRRAVASARRRRRRRRTVAAAVLVAVAAAAVAGARSPWLEVSEVAVRGVGGERAAAVAERVADARGTPLLQVDRRGQRADVAALPWVGEATVRRRLPDTLVVEVAPREPVALVEAGGGRWQVDAEAVVIAAGGDGDWGGLVIDGGDAAVAPPGEPLRDDTLRDAVAVADALPPGLADRVAAVDASRPRALALRLEDGPVAHLGSADRLEAKLDALALVLDDVARRDGAALSAVAEIDVRAPETPTVRRVSDRGQ